MVTLDIAVERSTNSRYGRDIIMKLDRVIGCSIYGRLDGPYGQCDKARQDDRKEHGQTI